jgi:hypothetical protein
MSFRRPSFLNTLGLSSNNNNAQSPTTQPRLKYQTSGEDGNKQQRKGSFTMLAQAASNFVSTIEQKFKKNDDHMNGALDGVIHSGEHSEFERDSRNIDSVNAAFTASFNNNNNQPNNKPLPKEFIDISDLEWVEDDFPVEKLDVQIKRGNNTEPLDPVKRAELERRVIAFLTTYDAGKPNHVLKSERIVEWAVAFGEPDVNAKLFLRFASGLQVARRGPRQRRGTNGGSFSEPSTLREQLISFYETHDPVAFAKSREEILTQALDLASKHGMDTLDRELKRKYGATVTAHTLSPRVSDLQVNSPVPPPPGMSSSSKLPTAQSLGNSPPMSPKLSNHDQSSALGSRKGSFLELDKAENDAHPWIPPPMSPIGSSTTINIADYCTSYNEAIPGRSYGVCVCGLSRADHKGSMSLFYVGEEGGGGNKKNNTNTVLQLANAIIGKVKGNNSGGVPNI